MTHTFFRSTLIALCLTALAAAPARSDSWFKFGGSAKKTSAEKATASSQNVVLTGHSDDDDDDDCDCDQCQRGQRHLCRFRSHRAGQNSGSGQGYLIEAGGCYPQLNSALYPCPKQSVPYEVGQTVITNQAFNPHEMLWAHQYRALYPPFFYENKCGLTCLPFFPKPCLRGTVVTVKYKSTYPCGFSPPWRATKTCYSNTQFR